MTSIETKVDWGSKGELVRELDELTSTALYRNEAGIYSVWSEGLHREFDNEVDALLFYIETMHAENEVLDGSDLSIYVEILLGGPKVTRNFPLTKQEMAEALLGKYEAFDEYTAKMERLWGYKRAGLTAIEKAQRAHIRKLAARVGAETYKGVAA